VGFGPLKVKVVVTRKIRCGERKAEGDCRLCLVTGGGKKRGKPPDFYKMSRGKGERPALNRVKGPGGALEKSGLQRVYLLSWGVERGRDSAASIGMRS